jgi:hypothetical protein
VPSLDRQDCLDRAGLYDARGRVLRHRPCQHVDGFGLYRRSAAAVSGHDHRGLARPVAGRSAQGAAGHALRQHRPAARSPFRPSRP